MNEVREIVTKAKVAKGKKNISLSYNIQSNRAPYSILGCWVINHEFEAERNDDLVDINGVFEVNIWYSTEQNMRTDVLREKVAYKKDIKVKRIVNEYLKNTDDILIKILKHPTVTNARIIDGEIKIDVDFEILAEVIGETKMQVTVFTPVTQEEDIDDLVIEVNDVFLG